ncbi:MAG: hypothetical protein F6K40_32535 [Okeania sp. SIO3I5]|uniref:hypothetical protein n=1 Tax=Okeania sp. SIO3I5 TaxID=2607805 RepID=UPI0013BE3330|nr:hypothetical protein [Okeania sp. SIO3I5]NEQ40698.1 hypothetical protein [Okeania sp. SIO3I5]
MKFPSIPTKILIFQTVPIIIGTVLVSVPSLAASFASSKGKVIIDHFSENPDRVGADANAEIFLSENGSEVYADAFAEANFVAYPGVAANADNSSASEVGGTGSNFFALGQSTTRVIGDFSIEEKFSFNFMVDFDLETSVENNSDESANAQGNVSFFIFETIAEGTPILLDFFGVSGNLESPGDNDFFSSTQNIVPSNFTILDSRVHESFGGNEEYVSAFFKGSYLRTFDGNQTRNIRLVQVKANSAQVQSTPEPSTTVAFLLFSVLGVATGLKSQKRE